MKDTMTVLRHLPAQAVVPSGCVATIGNFDGLHQGHQQVIEQVQTRAAALQLPAVLISFEPLPAEFFQEAPPKRVLPLRDKLRRLHELALDYFVCLRFDADLAQMEPEHFVQNILLQGLNVQHLVVGDDFRFGHGRRGNYQLLRQIGQQYGMSVENTATFAVAEQRISSTWIRELLAQGDLHKASELLGTPYQLSGRVRHGDKRGRTMGFPTLNLLVPDNIALCKGVYAVKVQGLGTQAINGVANLGARPTVHGLESRLEIHLFDFAEQVYGQHICVEPLTFLRDERRFESLQDLQTQIKQDAEQARDLLQP